MRNYVNVQQNTDEWFEMRAGKLTSSKLGVIMANYGKAFGEPAKKYAATIAVERLTGKPVGSDYTNDHMTRGHEQEPLARAEYEDTYFCDVDNGGFFTSSFIGCSPDGLVSDCGLVEIKSVIPSVQFATVKRQALDPAYKWQCIGNLKFTGREWIDYISYCQQYPEGKKIFVHRLFKDNLKEEFEQIDSRVEQFKKLVDSNIETIGNNKYFIK